MNTRKVVGSANPTEVIMTPIEQAEALMYGESETMKDLKRFFLVVLAGIIAVCYGVGMFYAGRATEATPDPIIYMVDKDTAVTTTTAP